MINIIHDDYIFNGGIAGYSNYLTNSLKDNNIKFNDITLKKIEFKIKNKRIGGFISRMILKNFLEINEGVVHSVDINSIINKTNVLSLPDIIRYYHRKLYNLSNFQLKLEMGKFKKIDNIENIIVFSNRVLNTIKESNIIDISNKNFFIIPIGIPELKYNENPYKDNEKLHLVTIGNFDIRKRFDVLYNYVGKLKDVELYHIGRIGNIDAYNNAMKHINPNVKYLGYLNNINEVNSYLKYADKFVFNSIDEGQGLPPLEAMKLGVQPIINDIEIYREMVGNLGFYYNTFDEFNELIYKKSNSPEILSNYVKKYDDWLNKTLGVYRIIEK